MNEQADIKKSELLGRIKAEILSLEPKAEIILYGSRARGDAREDSDWDLLILIEDSIDYTRKKRIYSALFHLELEFDLAFSAIVKSVKDWNLPVRKVSPFYYNVTREGVRI